MKRFLFFFLFTTIAFAQNTGLIVGKVLDKEMNNTPLAFASVYVKGTSVNVASDISGTFLLENLEDGDYTLVCGFPGYESKEIHVKVDSNNPSEIKLSLGAFALPQIETASVENSIEKKTLTQTTSLN